MRVYIWLLILILFSNLAFANQNHTITVSKKSLQFTITEKSNPSTGYKWVLKSYNSDVIKLISHKYTASQSNLLGAPGSEKWTFKVYEHASPQTTQIIFVYGQPWNMKSAETTTYDIVIK